MMRDIIAILIFTVGILCGNFSFARIVPFLSAFPAGLFEIRYLCLVALSVLFVYRRAVFDFRIYRENPIAGGVIAALGCLLAYKAWGTAFLWEKAADQSYLLSHLYLLLYTGIAPILIHNRQRLVLFANIALSTICTVILVIFILGDFSPLSLEKSALGSLLSFSRLCFVGFILGVFLFGETLRARGSLPKAILLLVIAGLFIFAGLLTYQRIALVFYLLTVGATCLLLVARRMYLTAFVAITVLCAGYGMAYAVMKGDMFSRIIYHTKLADGSDSGHSGIPPSCKYWVGKILGDNPAKKALKPESCYDTITINDHDGRLRLLKKGFGPLQSLWFGNGPGKFLFVQYSPLLYKAYVYEYPHNIFLSAWYESGLIGFGLLFVSVLMSVIISLRVFIEGDPALIPLLSLPVFYFVSSMLSGEIYDARFIWVVPLCLLCGLVARKTDGV